MALGIGNAGTKGSTPTVTAATGTANTITKYTAANTLGNSSITDTGALITLNNNVLIDGNADEVQLTVQGHSTQTSNILLVESSDGTDRFAVNNSGQALHGAGTVSLPGVSFFDDPNTGLYSSSDGVMNLSVDATRCTIYTSSLEGHTNGRKITWYSAGFAGLVAGIEHTPGTNVLSATDGAGGSGWIRNKAGDLVTTADQTVDSTTMANVTSLVTGTIATTRKISFEAWLFFSAGNTLADGVKVDFDQGTATATAFIAHAQLFDANALAALTAYRSTALATDFEATSTASTDFMMVIRGHLVVDAAGTFGLRFAKEADAGTGLTLRRGSCLLLKDMP